MIYLYLLAVLLVFFFLLGSCIYLATALYSALHKAPYVNTRKADLDRIFESLNIKEGQMLLDIGSSDGETLFYVCKHFNLKGKGIEINPILHVASKLKKLLLHNNMPVHFFQGSFKDKKIEAHFQNADYLYIYLLPELARDFFSYAFKLNESSQLRKNAIVISHEFQVQEFNKFLIKTVYHPHTKTYVYRF